MKRLIFFLYLIICGFGATAQNEIKTIHKDTINLRGYVYDADGKPCIATITSKSRDLIYNNEFISAVTDTAGYFELKGALVNDTLSVYPHSLHCYYFNKGARYMIINLPSKAKVDTIPYTHTSAITIEARRFHQRVTPYFQIKQPVKKNQSVLSDYENDAEFPGGIPRFTQYIQERLKYPAKAVENNIEGNVQVQFTINKTGAISDVKIIRGIGYGCDEEVINILKNSRKWKPGVFLAKLVETTKVVEVVFKLKDN